MWNTEKLTERMKDDPSRPGFPDAFPIAGDTVISEATEEAGQLAGWYGRTAVVLWPDGTESSVDAGRFASSRGGWWLRMTEEGKEA